MQSINVFSIKENQSYCLTLLDDSIFLDYRDAKRLLMVRAGTRWHLVPQMLQVPEAVLRGANSLANIDGASDTQFLLFEDGTLITGLDALRYIKGIYKAATLEQKEGARLAYNRANGQPLENKCKKVDICDLILQDIGRELKISHYYVGSHW